MNPRTYVESQEGGRQLQPTYSFLINCLLYSRMETGLVSNQDYYDEDVNVYLAHLLHSFLNPDYVEQSKKYLSRYDADVFRRLGNSTDARLKYVIYKTNADFLLVSVGLFDNPVVPAGPGQPAPGRVVTKPSEEAYVGRGKTYYHFAYTYSQQIHRRTAGVSDVIEKLSVGFDKYIKILSHMRGEPLDLVKRFSEGEVYHLERAVNESAREERIKAMQDELLELYSAWQREPSAEIEENVKRVVGEIQELSPSFRFSLPGAGGVARRRTGAGTDANTSAVPAAGSSPTAANGPAAAIPPAPRVPRTATGVAPEPAPAPRRRPRSSRGPQPEGGADGSSRN